MPSLPIGPNRDPGHGSAPGRHGNLGQQTDKALMYVNYYRIQRLPSRSDRWRTTGAHGSRCDMYSKQWRWARTKIRHMVNLGVALKAYNCRIPQRNLGHVTPLDALKAWRAKAPDLFKKRPKDLPGLDTGFPFTPSFQWRLLAQRDLNVMPCQHNKGPAGFQLPPDASQVLVAFEFF